MYLIVILSVTARRIIAAGILIRRCSHGETEGEQGQQSGVPKRRASETSM
jgi:hypothetical protein